MPSSGERVITSAGALQSNNRRLIGCLISFIPSAGYNRSRYIGSAFVPVFFELYNKDIEKSINRQLIGDSYSSSLLARQQTLKRFPALVITPVLGSNQNQDSLDSEKQKGR